MFGVPGTDFGDFLEKRFPAHAWGLLCAESRPYEMVLSDKLQELVTRGYETTLISDNMIGFCLSQKKADLVLIYYHRLRETFADCQGGSLLTAVLANELGVPCCLCPTNCTMPADDSHDPLSFAGHEIVPKGVKSFLPPIEKVPLRYVSETW